MVFFNKSQLVVVLFIRLQCMTNISNDSSSIEKSDINKEERRRHRLLQIIKILEATLSHNDDGNNNDNKNAEVEDVNKTNRRVAGGCRRLVRVYLCV